jgi:hemerythrin-like domain-containing protein
MKAIDELISEHEGIRLMLDIMEAVSWKIMRDERVPSFDLDSIGEFLSVFADKCHHGKEEEGLFPAFEKAGMPREGGPIGVMLEEHEQGRRMIAEMKSAISDMKEGTAEAGDKVSSTAMEYVALLRQHIEKENTVLFPMADRLLDESAAERLSELFERIEHDRIGPGKHKEFHSMLDRMKKAYLG